MSKKPRIIKTSWKKNFFDMKTNLKKNRGYCDCERTCEHITGDACANTEKMFLPKLVFLDFLMKTEMENVYSSGSHYFLETIKKWLQKKCKNWNLKVQIFK